MAHYAKVNNGIVETVIIAEADFFNNFIDDSPGTWIQTSYNTKGGVHALGGTPLRKNYATKGFSYDKTRDAFIPPKPPFSSWKLNEDSCTWEAPISEPDNDNRHSWNEDTQEWISSDV